MADKLKSCLTGLILLMVGILLPITMNIMGVPAHYSFGTKVIMVMVCYLENVVLGTLDQSL